MSFRGQKKWSTEHFRHCGTDMLDEQGQNGQYERGNRQSHVEA